MVKFIQHKICQQWGSDASLGSPFLRVAHTTIRHFDWCGENAFYYKKKMLIVNSQRPNLSNQFCMIYIVKESFNIKFYYIVQICVCQLETA